MSIRHLSFRLSLSLSLLLSLSLSPTPLRATIIEQVVVVVDGDPYTLTDLKDYARTRKNHNLSNEELTHANGETKTILEHFITEKLLAAEVDRLGIKVREEDIDRFIENVQTKNQISSAQLRAALEQEGMDIEQYRASIRVEIEKGMLINRQVEKKVNIFPDDVERYYQAHKNRFMTKDRAHLLHILIRTLDDPTPEQKKASFSKALKIRKRALQGEDFSQLAREYSEGAGASEGGDIGWVERSSLLDQIAKVAFKLSAGEISQPVRTSLGVHLIKLEELQPAGFTPLSQVREKIKEELHTKALEERFQRWLRTDLRKKHLVDVKLPGFVFRAEETKESTANSRMASELLNSSDDEERGFLSYLNPFSYFVSETPLDYGEGENLADETIIKVFGTPLFVTESGGDPEAPLIPSEEGGETGESEESQNFFSSMWDSINPF